MDEHTLTCPYCWEEITIMIDPEEENHATYIEDCWVCCRPIQITLTRENDGCFSVVHNAIEGNES